MSEVPANTVTQADFNLWLQLVKDLARVKAAEMLLRTKIFKAYFPEPAEGTNSYDLSGGWVMKANYPIDRKIDEGVLGAYSETLKLAGISKDKLVKYEPKLVITEYRKLTKEEQQIFDNCLIVKPGSPSIKVELPAKAKAALDTGAA